MHGFTCFASWNIESLSETSERLASMTKVFSIVPVVGDSCVHIVLPDRYLALAAITFCLVWLEGYY